jgi:ribosomal protein L19
MSNILLKTSPVVQAQMRTDIPEFVVGSIVEVAYKIIEGGKERVQKYKGIVTNRHNKTDMDSTFTVMKNSTFNTKVERTFPVNSPLIAAIVVSKFQRARRSNIRTQFTVKDPLNVRARAIKSRPDLMNNLIVAAAPVVEAPKAKVDADVSSQAEAPKAFVETSSAVNATNDDLTIVEGIGPKIAELFIAQGISTFALLADADVATLQAILDENSLGGHKADTWPTQAELARDGKMEELETLKAELNAGKAE